MQLEVARLDDEDIFRDRVRIPAKFRSGIPSGKICRLHTTQASILVEVRAKGSSQDPHIYMDQITRQKLGLKVGSVEEFRLKQVGWIGQLIWASRAADPASRIAAQLGLISLILGLLSIILAIPWTCLLKLLWH